MNAEDGPNLSSYQTHYELEQAWTTPEGIAGVSLRFGDRVRITSAGHEGESGEVVALVSLKPEPLYVVELPAGESVAAKQSELIVDGPNSGRQLLLPRL